jgi:exopolysaccharide biosynthesis polyprenyl glycosylphosphotransferase
MTVPRDEIAEHPVVGPEPYVDRAFQAPVSMPAGLRRRRQVRTAVWLLPAVVAVVASFVLGDLTGAAAVRGIALAVAILATAAMLRNLAEPYRLMPAARLTVATLPVLVGGLVVGVLAVTDAYGLRADNLVAATALALLVAVAAEMVGQRLLAARPLRIAILGSPSFAAGLSRELEASPAQHTCVVGWINLGDRDEAPVGVQRIGSLDSIRSVVAEHGIDLLVRGAGSPGADEDRRTYDAIAQRCMDLPVRMIDGNQLYEQLFGHVPLGRIDSDWYLFLMHPSFESTPPLQKRLFDLAGGLAASLVALPLIALGALLVKLEDPRGPVFYRQRRVGERGREFEILKLRSMTTSAEDDGAQWSDAADARVTRAGRILRRTHVDELPQLLNVLRGDMTLVGPRPERPEIIAELERLFPHYKRRLMVKPGVTGWAQVRCGYAGSALGTAWKLCHDLYYLKHRNLLADALIMIETVAIAAKDSHRPMRAPQPEFLFSSPTPIEDPVADTVEVAVPKPAAGEVLIDAMLPELEADPAIAG